MKYDILSPDGISIYPRQYPSVRTAKKWFNKWKQRFEKQGYYSANTGRIPLIDLEQNCTLAEL